MRYGPLPILAGLAAGLAVVVSSAARAADKARVSGFADASFGIVTGFGDQSISQSLCAYSSSKTATYSVMASGDGAAGAFALSSGSSQLGYDVLWADAPNLSGGTALAPNVPLSGLTSTASQQSCISGPPASASLTIVLRDSILRSALAGSYSGAVQITIAPE